MIQHLNQQNFQSFGTISPERRDTSELFAKPSACRTVQLSHSLPPLYLSQSECWVCPGSGMTSLALSLDNKTFERFYLDKPVCIRPGVFFSLSPIQDQSSAKLSGFLLPQQVGSRPIEDDIRTYPKTKVECLYTLFYHEKEQGFFFPGESHPMLELTYVDGGSIHSVADGKDLLLEQGDMVLYSPNQWHMQYADMNVAPRYVTVSFEISGQLPDSLFNRKLKAPQSALSLFNQILREQDSADIYSGDMILSLLSQLLITLQRTTGISPERLKAPYSIHSENAIIRQAQQYISTHVRQKLSVPLVAKQVDVSPSYLTALFHKHLQIAPGEYIRRIKLQESKQMIRENTMNFTEIAAALQYSTVHHFSRQFKEKFGITPSEYAKSVR